MPLDEYQRKRDFESTPEPKGYAQPSDSGRLFVVQKHRASHLHYDLRIELDGVLVSWAVPKGPSLDPSEKRLAVHVEDHPVEYGEFEGVIPEGDYGGGVVMLWDRGQWASGKDLKRSLKEGNVKIDLSGHKLRGKWALVRMKSAENDRNWLLIKEKDEYARLEDEYCVQDEEPFSVVSGRGLQDIGDARDCTWTDDGPVGESPRGFSGRQRGHYVPAPLDLSAVPRAEACSRPGPVTLPTPHSRKSAPEGDQWLHEIKYAGRRVVIRIEEEKVVLDAPDGEVTHQFPEITSALTKLPVASATLDGVVTQIDADGVPDSDALTEAIHKRNTRGLRLFVFDLVYCNGFDLRKAPLLARKQALKQLIGPYSDEVTYSDHVIGNGQAVLENARQLGAPGIVSKKINAEYAEKGAGRWVQIDITSDRPKENRKPSAPRSLRRLSLEIAGVTITNPGRLLYAEERVTKRDLAEYYETIADRILPHIAGRPLSLFRCPRGFEREGFFQKHLRDMPANHLKSVDNPKDESKEPYIILESLQGLITLAQWSVLEIHPWGCKADKIDKPDRLIFDLDPGPGATWQQLAEGAKGLRFLLDELGLDCYLKTSGGKGLHVVAPIERRTPWDKVKEFSAAIAKRIVEVAPRHFTALTSLAERERRVFIDYLRNARGATCVSPFSTRARPGARVSHPIPWSSLDLPRRDYTLSDALQESCSDKDPWEGFFAQRQSITRANLDFMGCE